MILYAQEANEKQTHDFGQKIFEKIDGGFFSEDFFAKVLEGIKRNEENYEPPKVAEMYINFAYECYVHGVDVGMETATEIYMKSGGQGRQD